MASKAYIVPEDLLTETLITYPVERDRLDIFTRFLKPAISNQRRSHVGTDGDDDAIGGQRRGVCGMPIGRCMNTAHGVM